MPNCKCGHAELDHVIRSPVVPFSPCYGCRCQNYDPDPQQGKQRSERMRELRREVEKIRENRLTRLRERKE